MRSLRLILSNKNYFAPAFVFASLNIWFGTWAIYIPHVKEKLGIDKAELGFAIFFLSLGVFLFFPFAPKVINRLGVGRATWLGLVLGSIFALLPLAAPNYIFLCVALFLMGTSFAMTDIAMNTLVTEIEKKNNVQFMSAAHGFFSLGGILVGLGSFLIPFFGNPWLHMFVAVLMVFLINLSLKKHFYRIKAEPIEKEAFSFNLFRPLFVLGLISFISMGSEGAIVDWSALYLKEVSIAPEYLIGAGFLAFSTTMTLGRFLGDGINQKLGSITSVTIGSLVAMTGFLFVLSGNTILAIIGFALNGLGLSVMVPELFRIGGNVKGVESSQGVAFIGGSGYLGFTVGPVVLGYLAEGFSLKTSFWVLLGCMVLVLLLTSTFKSKKA